MQFINRHAAMVCGVLLYASLNGAHAAPPADNLLERIAKQGYISDPLDGSRSACPCKLIGVAREGETEVVFVATNANAWYSFSCTAIKGGAEKYICLSRGRVMGAAMTF